MFSHKLAANQISALDGGVHTGKNERITIQYMWMLYTYFSLSLIFLYSFTSSYSSGRFPPAKTRKFVLNPTLHSTYAKLN